MANEVNVNPFNASLRSESTEPRIYIPHPASGQSFARNFQRPPLRLKTSHRIRKNFLFSLPVIRSSFWVWETDLPPQAWKVSLTPSPRIRRNWEEERRVGERCNVRERSYNSLRLLSLIFPWRSPRVQFPVITLTSPQWELAVKRRRAWLMSGRQSLYKWGS
jgi:hypothetical protein